MSSGTSDSAADGSRGDKSIELEHLMVQQCNDLENMKQRTLVEKMEDFIYEQTSKVDQCVNVKHLCSVWGPTVDIMVRLMLVSCFLDDSLGTMMHFPSHIKAVGGGILTTVALGIGLLAQFIGSVCLLMLKYPDGAIKALIGWTIFQPILYGQILNLEFVAESISLIGGLLMMRALLFCNDAKTSRTQFFGRLLLPVMYIYYAGQFFFDAFTLDESSSVGMFISNLSLFVLNFLALIALLISSMLVSVGLQSRLVAFVLAIANIAYVFYSHPFLLYIYFSDGEWKLRDMPMPNVVLPEGTTMSPDDLWKVYDLHKYYFFLGMSTSGALLILTQFGPGDIALQKDELILPTRAID